MADDAPLTPGRSAGYQFRQCQDVGCRFRYPARSDDRHARCCPRCGGTTTAAAMVAVGTARPQSPDSPPRSPRSLYVLLDNVRSAYNVGSILRTADGAGVAHIHLCGITPTPDQAKVAKTALGAEACVPWSHHANSVDLAARLKETSVQIIALERTQDAVSVFSPLPDHSTGAPLLLVVGNELTGIDPDLLTQCDLCAAIPMRGHKRSLNVATAFGIAAYALTTR